MSTSLASVDNILVKEFRVFPRKWNKLRGFLSWRFFIKNKYINMNCHLANITLIS